MAQLSWSADGAARTVDLDGDMITVGSDPSCTAPLAGKGISPVHCEIRRGPDGWRVVDLESRAGTKVNGEFVNTRTLRDWDVLDVGGVQITFRDDSPAAAQRPAPAASAAPARPARPQKPAAAAPARAARPAAPARAARAAAPDAAADEEPPRRGRRGEKGADSAKTGMLIVAGGLVAILLIWFMFTKLGSGTENHKIRVQMSEAESLMNYQKAIDLAAQAQSDDSHDWQEMQKIVARCKAALAAQGVGAQIETSIKEWNRIRVWRQDNGTADEEFVKRIDEYLVRWKTIESEGTRQAKVARVRVTGSSGGDAAATGDAAWQAVMEDVKLMEADGRFGDAIAKIDAYWEANKSAAPTMVAPVEAEKKRLEAAAGKWFDKQLAVAIHYWVDNNDKFKSKKILENAGQKIGLPGYAERAAEEYQKLVSGKK